MGSKGFTIVESLISLVLLGIMMAGGAGFYTYAAKHNYERIHQRLAVELTNSALEAARSSPVVGTTSEIVVIDFVSFTKTTLIAPVTGQGYNTVTVSVSWIEPGFIPPQQFLASTYVAI